MKPVIFRVTTFFATWLAWVAVAFSAQVVGIVKNANDVPVQGVKISLVDASGKTLGQGLTRADGRYLIDNLPNGKYVFKLDPLKTGFQPGDGAGYLSDKGLTVNWKVSPNAVALDDVVPGTGIPDWLVAGASALFVAGGTLGGLAAGGVIGGGSGSSHKIASPSQ
jgi:Carboxypeptidase regulatory-like domain